MHQQRQTKSADDVMRVGDHSDNSHPPRRNSDPIPINQIHQQQQASHLEVSVNIENQQPPQQFDNNQSIPVSADIVVVESSEDEDEVSMEPAIKRTKPSNDHVTTNGDHVNVADDLEDFDNIISTFCEE